MALHKVIEYDALVGGLFKLPVDDVLGVVSVRVQLPSGEIVTGSRLVALMPAGRQSAADVWAMIAHAKQESRLVIPSGPTPEDGQ